MEEPMGENQVESSPSTPRRPRFSILTMLMILTVIGLGLALFLSRQETATAKTELEKANQMRTYLEQEAGYFEIEDETKLYIRELENQVPCARRYLVSFPHGYYHVVAGDYLGGELAPANVKKRFKSRTFLKMRTNMSIHIFNDPKGNAMYSVDMVDFTSGRAGGGYLPDYEINVNKLNFADDQQGQAAEWRIINKKPHGELRVYDSGTTFIPLFVLEEGISVKNKDGKFEKCKGIAFWIEPVNPIQAAKPNGGL